MPPHAPAAFGKSSLSTWLVNTALARIPRFKYIVGAAALLIVAAAATRVWPDTRAGLIAGIGLLPLAFALYLFEKVPPSGKNTRVIAATVFWALAVALIVLLCLFVIWTGRYLLNAAPPHPSGELSGAAAQSGGAPNAAERAVLAKIHDIEDLATKWQSALLQRESAVAQLSTSAANAAGDLIAVDSSSLGPEYRVSRLRYGSFGYLMACSSAQLSHDAAPAYRYCVQAQKAGQEALEAAAQIERRGANDPQEQTVLDWTRGQSDRILRANAEIDAVLLKLTGQKTYRRQACDALDQISLGYRAEDPPSTSAILRGSLGLQEGSDVCTER